MSGARDPSILSSNTALLTDIVVLPSAAIYGQRVNDKLYKSVEVSNDIGSTQMLKKPMQGAANAVEKDSPAGLRGSYMAAIAVGDKAKRQRDELLAQVAQEE